MSLVGNLFAKSYLPKKLAKALSHRLASVENMAKQQHLSKKQLEYQEIGLKIQDELNHFERYENPRRDPALKGLYTDKWRVYYYVNYTGKQTRGYHQQFDYKFRFVIVNLQKPYRYKLDLTDYDYTLYGGKVFSNLPIYAMTDKEKKRMRSSGNFNHIPTGYVQETKRYSKNRMFGDAYDKSTYAQTSYKSKDPSGVKVGSKRVGTIGNLAAVRLATKGNIVKPTHAKRIIFWVSRIRRIDSKGNTPRGRKLATGGYVFVGSRQYNIGGHDWYRKKIEDIINKHLGKYNFIDKTW